MFFETQCMFVLNAKLHSIWALILEVFGGFNLVSLSLFFYFFSLKKSGLIFSDVNKATTPKAKAKAKATYPKAKNTTTFPQHLYRTF